MVPLRYSFSSRQLSVLSKGKEAFSFQFLPFNQSTNQLFNTPFLGSRLCFQPNEPN